MIAKSKHRLSECEEVLGKNVKQQTEVEGIARRLLCVIKIEKQRNNI